MARLIPSFFDEAGPPGERDVFRRLARAPEDWVVLHSLDLSPWNSRRRTEIDFVIVIPDLGILCVEVKSQTELGFDGSRWYPDSIKRSPFRQAADGRYTLRRNLAELQPSLGRIPVAHCCIFPFAAFSVPANLSIQRYEFVDRSEFNSANDGAAFCRLLRSRLQSSIEADAAIKPLTRAITKNETELFIQTCLPVRLRRPELRQEIEQHELEMKSILREQQKQVLRMSALNPRLIVLGAAGTGKTFLAVELARRAATQGIRVALLCYNRLVGEWLKKQFPDAPPNLVVGRVIQIMAEIAGVDIPADADEQFWNNELPQILEERLTDPAISPTSQFDLLIVDEAQDLLSRPSLWQCAVHLLEGGLNRGSFVFLGDFERQVLGKRDSMLQQLDELQRQSAATRWVMSENLRNYRIVGQTALTLAGFGDDVYSDFLRTGGGSENYGIAFHSDDAAQLEQLTLLLRDFRARGFRPYEIVLLSQRSDFLSASSRLGARGLRLAPAWQVREGHVPYATIHAFKGLEAKVVILTDILLNEGDFQRDLFYTGLTRATEYVRVLCDQRSKETLLRWISETQRKQKEV